MGLAPWITCLWPGLPRLWWRGQWSGVGTAVLFALWLNFTLILQFVAPHLLPPWGRMVNGGILAVAWVVCIRRATTNLPQLHSAGPYDNALFCRAQEEYLQGHWFETESLLLRLVGDNPADVEGRLLLATLYRHTNRRDLARAQLDQLQRFPHANRWAWEIRQERARLENLAEATASSAEAADEGQTPGPTAGENPATPRLEEENRAPNGSQAAGGEEGEKSPIHGGLSKAA